VKLTPFALKDSPGMQKDRAQSSSSLQDLMYHRIAADEGASTRKKRVGPGGQPPGSSASNRVRKATSDVYRNFAVRQHVRRPALSHQFNQILFITPRES
jgi:hypothetical protein